MAFQADSFISDEEEEVCPLCVEEMDISDRNFKPCPCGYQICQFCYNNIRQNPQLNGRCPGCRRPYDDESVEYKVISPEEWKKHHVKQTKQERERKQKEREKKEMEQSSRKHLSGMRVIQKNLVYVIGLNPDIPTEDLHNTLRGEQFFGQYGRIQKIVINRRNNVNGTPGLGVYVTFAKKEDAARCIAAVDGSMNDGKYLRAAYGTTKYCSSYLRGQPCPNPNCMFLHEPGEEADSYTRQDLSTIQHAARQGIQKQQRQQQQQQRYGDFQHSQPSPVQPNTPIRHQSGHAAVAQHATEDIHGNALPATASWAKQSPTTPAGKLHTPSQASPVKPAPVEPAVNYPMPDPDPKRQMDFTLPLFKNTLKSLSKNKFDFVFSSAILKSLDLDDDKSSLPSLFAFSKGNIMDPSKHESTEFLEGQFTPFAIFSGGKAAALPLASDETQSFQQLMKGGPTDKVPDQAATPPPGLMGDSNQKQHHSQELLAHLMNGGKKEETTRRGAHNVKSVLAAGYEDSSLSPSMSPPGMSSELPVDYRSPEETLRALSEGPMTLTRDFDPELLEESVSSLPFGAPPGLSSPPGLSGTPGPSSGLSGPPGLVGPPGLAGPRPETAVYNSMEVEGFDKSPLDVNRPAIVRPEPFHAHVSMTPGVGFGSDHHYEMYSDDEEDDEDDDYTGINRAVGPPQDDDNDMHGDDLRSVTSGGAPSEIDFAGSRPATPDLDLPEPPRILSSEHISVLSKNEKRKYRNSLKAYEREKKLAIKNYKKEQEDAERAERAALTTIEEEEAQAKKAQAQKACEEVEDAAETLKKALEAAEAEKKAKEAAAEEEARIEKQRLKEEKQKIKEEKARVKAEKALKHKEEKEKRDAERLKRAEERKEKERVEAERKEKERAEKEQLEKAEKERYEKSLLAMKKEKAEKVKREKAEKERVEKERIEKLRLAKEAKEAAAAEKEASKPIVAPQPKLASNMSTSTWDEDESSSLNYNKPSNSADDHKYNSFNSGSSRRGASGQIGGHLADYLASPSPKPSSPSVASTPELESAVSATSTASTNRSHVPAGASSQFSVGDLLRSIVEEVDLAEHPVFDIQNPALFHDATVDVMIECEESVDVFEKAIADKLLTEPVCPDTKDFVSEDIEKFIADPTDSLLHLSKEIDEDVFIDDLDLEESDDDPLGSLPEFARGLIAKHAHLIDPKWQEVAVHIDDLNQVDDEELPYRQNLAEEVFQLQNEVDKCLARNQRLVFRHTGKRLDEEE